MDHRPSIRAAVRDALETLGECSSLTVLVNDPQRHTDSGAVLRELSALAPRAALRVLVAAGSHSFAPQARRAFEDSLPPECRRRVAWHDSRAPAVPLGGWHGHAWLADDSSPLLGIGSVEPHYFAGFTGAHKTATIGVAALSDIERNHERALDPACRPCRLEGNPIFEGVAAMVGALERVNRLAVVNLVQSGREVVFAAGGAALATLRRALAAARARFVRSVDRQADIVVAEVTGALGSSFYQADKGIKNNECAVRDGGAIVLVAPCGEGIGQAAFTELLRLAPTYRDAVELMRRRGYRLGDHKAVRLRRLCDPCERNVRVVVVSPGLSPEDAGILGLLKAGDMEHAMEIARGHAGAGCVQHVSDAGNTCLEVAPAAG